METEFKSIKIGLASPEMIRKWSSGEVTKPETINYRTLKAEVGGLFCEKIFGPTKDYTCSCGKYKAARSKEGHTCEKCGVDIVPKKVRRERMGRIELAAPVSHIWYFKAPGSRMALVLNMSPKSLEQVLYFSQNVVLDPGPSDLVVGQVLSEAEADKVTEAYGDLVRMGMGAESIKELLSRIDIDKECASLREALASSTGAAKSKIIKRLDILEAFQASGNRPEWMILDNIPVLPPDIRPMVQLDGGRFASSDLNELYRRVITRNNRLRRLIEIATPEIVVRNEKRILQEAVDALIDNGRRGKPVTGASNRPMKSLSEMLRGKQGRFRQNLLGKRVDYSGRSVIVVGPSLKIYQCGLPKEMALELFKPFIIKRLVEIGKATNVKDAQKKIDRAYAVENACVWDALDNVIKEHPVLLNRAPTLHRLSIQAFEPILVEGRAIKLHPLVCTAFNADFDGDQMPVHVPLSVEAQAEARFLMLSANNLLKPMNGQAVTVPTQDMILGAYYLTMDRAGEKGEGKCFRDFDEANMAYLNGDLGLHAPIRVRVSKERNGKMESQVVQSTLGRLIYNRSVPQNLGFVDRSKPENFFLPEIDFIIGKTQLEQIINRCFARNGTAECAKMLDEIKSLGYTYSTKASFSISVYDIGIPKTKSERVATAQQRVDQINRYFRRGELNEDERYDAVIRTWKETDKAVSDDVTKALNRYNPIMIMVNSGARGSMKQLKQLAGMRGSMFSATGKTIELPIISNFREGMNIAEYFIGARSSRKSLSDTALRTADSGYMTRRLVDVAQEVVIREEKCDTTRGMWVSNILSADGQVLEKLSERIIGRYTMGDVIDPRTGEVLVKDDTMISDDDVKRIEEAGIDRVYIRSVIQCHAHKGICAHCYGADLATNQPVTIGEAVGIIAAQSIGEPGTQLTMRTFHSGGIAGSNITQGLPRVDELFEARQPKKPARIAEHSGVVHISAVENTEQNRITYESEETGEKVDEVIPYGHGIIVSEGEHVVKGQALTEGSKTLEDIMRIQGLDAVYEYLIKEVQTVYRDQSCDINDKHIEIIARQMTRKVQVTDAGSTRLLPTTLLEKQNFEDIRDDVIRRREAGQARLVELKDKLYKNEDVDAEEYRKAEEESQLAEPTAVPVLLAISKAALLSESFLAAAAFQETMSVLTDAAVRGRVDHLEGLKENVMIGKLLPAGTGADCYQRICVSDDDPLPDLPPISTYEAEPDEGAPSTHGHYGFVNDPSRLRREKMRAEARAKAEALESGDGELTDEELADNVDAILDAEETDESDAETKE